MKDKDIDIEVTKDFTNLAIQLEAEIKSKITNHDSSYPIREITEKIVNVLKKDEELFKLYNYDENDELTLEAYSFHNDLLFLYDKPDEEAIKKAKEFLKFLVTKKEFTSMIFLEGISSLPVGLKLGPLEIMDNREINEKYTKDIEDLSKIIKNSIPMRDLIDVTGSWGRVVFRTYQYRYSVQILRKELELPLAILSLIMKTDLDAKDVLGFMDYNSQKVAYLYPLKYREFKYLAWFKYDDSLGYSTYDKKEDKYLNMISSITQKRKFSPLEKRIVGSIYLYGASRLSYKTEIRFIMVVFACDSLLTGSKDCLTLKLSERTAYLIEEDGEKRYELFEKMKEIYDKRSEIVHRGTTTISSQDVIWIDEIYRKLLFKVLDMKTEFNETGLTQSKDDVWLEELFNKMKFSK